MSYNNTEIGNSYIKSEAEVIAVKIQYFKRIPTSYLSYHHALLKLLKGVHGYRP